MNKLEKLLKENGLGISVHVFDDKVMILLSHGYKKHRDFNFIDGEEDDLSLKMIKEDQFMDWFHKNKSSISKCYFGKSNEISSYSTSLRRL